MPKLCDPAYGLFPVHDVTVLVEEKGWIIWSRLRNVSWWQIQHVIYF